MGEKKGENSATHRRTCGFEKRIRHGACGVREEKTLERGFFSPSSSSSSSSFLPFVFPFLLRSLLLRGREREEKR